MKVFAKILLVVVIVFYMIVTLFKFDFFGITKITDYFGDNKIECFLTDKCEFTGIPTEHKIFATLNKNYVKEVEIQSNSYFTKDDLMAIDFSIVMLQRTFNNIKEKYNGFDFDIFPEDTDLNITVNMNLEKLEKQNFWDEDFEKSSYDIEIETITREKDVFIETVKLQGFVCN